MRYATWRRRPEDPRTAAGWIVRHTPLGAAQKRTFWLLVPLTLGVVALGWFWLGFAGVLFSAVLSVVGLAVYARPGAREHAALPTLGEDAAFPVTFEVFHRGSRTGRENGWVAFADGWLVYEGLRTSFSVTPSSVRAKRKGVEIRLKLPNRGRARLILLTDFMQTGRPANRHDARRFKKAFRAWVDGPSPEGEPVLPPKETSLGVAGDRVGEALLGATLCVALGIVFLFTHVWLGAFATGIGLALCMLSYRNGVRHLRKSLPEQATPTLTERKG